MKYPLSNRRVRVIHGYHKISKKCYIESLKLKTVRTMGVNTRKVGSRMKPPEKALRDEEALPQEGEKIKY